MYMGQQPYAGGAYPQLQGGQYNQMTQMFAGPQYSPLSNPYARMQGTTPYGGGAGMTGYGLGSLAPWASGIGNFYGGSTR